MDGPFTRLLLTHGALVLVAGVLAGYGFWVQLLRKRPELEVRPWRVAHTTLLMMGLTMLVAGLLDARVNLPVPIHAAAARLLVLSGWGFTFAMVAGALTGIRGLGPKPWGVGTVFFVGHTLGAAGSTIGLILVAWGLLRQP